MASNRQRVRKACEACKARKRRCDGHDPCSSCVRYDYTCEYLSRSTRRSNKFDSGRTSFKAAPDQLLSKDNEDCNVYSTPNPSKHVDFSSATSFPRMLGQELSQGGDMRVQMASWNLGLRDDAYSTIPDITALLSLDEMDSLTNSFLEKVNNVYAIFEPQLLAQAISIRWGDSGFPGYQDCIFYGVAALGSLFTNCHDKERELVQYGKDTLDAATENTSPSLEDVAGWILRALYIRCTSGPCATWIASCTTMHIIQHTKAHKSAMVEKSRIAHTCIFMNDNQARQRLVWISMILNTWISFEHGQPRVHIRDLDCDTPSASTYPNLGSLIQLYMISEQLDPDYSESPLQLDKVLTQIENIDVSSPVVALSQSNMALSFYRKMRFIRPTISGDIPQRLIRLGKIGVQAAVKLAMEHCPWWHVANVPFQFLCTLLSMDTRESLSHVGATIRSLKSIAQYFDSRTMNKVVESADILVSLSKYKKSKDLNALNEGLQDSGATDSVHTETILGETSTDFDFDWAWDTFLNDDFLFLGSQKLGLDFGTSNNSL
ncbi:hypothetical protein N7456_005629 [Penicillium angulare]|uniref:Zn(2)-C6 fungal-type domain-containing protein n=1 Tax=Penicillium angulare TaxID=116970 RepID=A0A9W9FYQ7_9EURO|nr:hypothetical protein N7456_005629 [Penicillium angulare]